MCGVKLVVGTPVNSSDCGIPPEVYNATSTYDVSTVGGVANYTCTNPDDAVFAETGDHKFWADCAYVERDILGVTYLVAEWTATDGCVVRECFCTV